MAFPVGAAIIGGSSLAAGAISAGGSKRAAKVAAKQSRWNTEQTIKANKEMAEYQYAKNLEMWNRQNEYNTPEAQMKRFGDAGLNPNLIYGQGDSGNARTMPQYQAPEIDYSGIQPGEDPQGVANAWSNALGGVISAYQNFEVKQAQIDNIKAMTRNTDERTFNETLKSALMTVDKATRDFKLSHMKNLAPHQVAASKEEVNRLKSQISTEAARQALLSVQKTGQLHENKYLKYKGEQAEKGINVSDPIWLRFLGKYAKDILENVKIPMVRPWTEEGKRTLNKRPWQR